MGSHLVTICDDISCKTSKVGFTIGFYRAWSFSIGECTRAQLDAISEALLKRSRWLLLSLFALFVGASPTFMGIKYNG